MLLNKFFKFILINFLNIELTHLPLSPKGVGALHVIFTKQHFKNFQDKFGDLDVVRSRPVLKPPQAKLKQYSYIVTKALAHINAKAPKE